MRIDNSTFERVEEFKYLGTTLTIQNSIREEIKSRLRSGNACYHLVQNLLSSRLLSRKLKIKIYRTIILPVVLYGCEAWSLTLREERKLRVFENMVLRRIFGPRRDEVTGEWKRLHNEELSDLYPSPNIVRVIKSRRMRRAAHVARMGEERGAYRVLVGKPEGKRPLGRPRRRWVDNIRMDLQEVGCGYVDWIGLAQDRDRWRVCIRRGGCIGSWWGNRRERGYWGDLGVDGWIILGWISRRWDVGMWTGLGWPRIGIDGGRL